MITSEKVKRNLNEQNLNVQLYGIKNQVVELYYSIILLNRQNEILDSSIAYLNIRKKSLESMVRNGVILNSDLDKMELEILKIEQNQAGLQSKMNVLISALSNLTGINISAKRLNSSDNSSDNFSDKSLIWTDRPEIKLFSLKNELLDANSKLIDLKNKPKLALFLKAGFGYPNPFNFFDNSFSPFAMGGVNFAWNIWDWKRTDLDKQKLLIEKDLIENQKNIFDENMKLEADKLVTEISGLENNAVFDNKIIGRQKSIIEVTENQYKNGVVSINVYLEEINKKSIAELNAIIHQIEIQKAKYKLKILLNN
jgi:outer membrane protein TolC